MSESDDVMMKMKPWCTSGPDIVVMFGNFSLEETTSAHRKSSVRDEELFGRMKAKRPFRKIVMRMRKPTPTPAPTPTTTTTTPSLSTTSSVVVANNNINNNPSPRPAQQPTPTPTKQAAISLRHPRGLVNAANTCFKNSILQALLASAGFRSMLESLAHADAPPSKHPVLSQLISFLRAYDTERDAFPALGASNTPKAPREVVGLSAPRFCEFTRYLDQGPEAEGKQQDAHEFMSFLLDALHEELLATQSHIIPRANTSTNDEWSIVGKNSKPILSNTIEHQPSIVSALFGIGTRSTIEIGNNRRQSTTLQPHSFSIHLDIAAQGVNSVETALAQYTKSEKLEDFVCDKTHAVVAATKCLQFETLGEVVILHFKRFTYRLKQGEYSAQKVQKLISFPLAFQINKSHFSSLAQDSQKNSMLRLFAVVRHHGHEVSTGHYTCDAQHPDSGKWIRFNDMRVTSITLDQALDQTDAYVLFYSRK
eukprot:c12169_g1_i2.p1 GENE.c12169_g1_i2~~c12169_g1_i2.p1  ORF type:complete len:480 (+),score=117.49 c12169_g1_i2:122-1561(+)